MSVYFDVYGFGEANMANDIELRRRRSAMAKKLAMIAVVVMVVGLVFLSKSSFVDNSLNLVHQEQMKSVSNPLQVKASAAVACSPTPSTSSMICIPAGHASGPGFTDTAFASFVVPSGGLLSKIILTWKSGEMKFCGMASAANCKGRWGMSLAGYGFGVYVSRNDGATLLYPTGGVKGISRSTASPLAWYSLASSTNTFNGASFTMDLGAQFTVTAGEVLRFYSGEVFSKVAYGDNFGQTCADVQLVFDQGPTDVVCIPARDNSGSVDFAFGAIASPLTGTLHGVQLDVLSGGINYCPPSPTCSGTFGSTVTDYQIYMTRQNPLQILFPTGGTRGITPGAYNGYKLPANNQSLAQRMILDLPQQPVAVNEELRFYVGEMLKRTTYTDNSGQLCLKVTFNISKTTTCSSLTTAVQCSGHCTLNCVWDVPTSACRCASPPVDFVFLVDGSGSISPSSFLVQKQMVKDMISQMIPANSSVGIIQFASVLQDELNLVPQVSQQTALGAVDGMTQLRTGTNIGDALDRALNNPNFLANSLARPDQRIILVTDGKWNVGRDPCSVQSQIQGMTGLRVLIVGVSSGFDRAGVQCLVQHQPNPASWIIEIPNYSLSEFQAVAPELNAKVCV